MLSLFTYTLSYIPTNAQGTWTSRDTLPDSAMCQGIPGFSINGYGYAGLGDESGFNKVSDELWQFNSSTNSWKKMASFPGKARVAPACFVIGENAYLVTGSVSNSGACLSECWQYNSTSNTWTQKANFPGAVRTYAVGFAIDSLGYVGTGANELSDFHRDFYAYHPSTNTWTNIADFPGIARDGDCGFAANGKGYVCFGQDSTIHYHRDMWEYDPVANTWTQKADFPGAALLLPSGFVICDNIYVGEGQDTTDLLNPEIWKYNTLTDTWLQMASVPGIGRIEGAAFSIGDTGYYGFGIDYTTKVHNIFDKFYAGDSCHVSEGYQTINNDFQFSIYPNPFSASCTISFSQNFLNSPPVFSLYDMEGAKQEINLSGAGTDYVLKRSGLKDGVYLLAVKYQDQVFYKKLIIIN